MARCRSPTVTRKEIKKTAAPKGVPKPHWKQSRKEPKPLNILGNLKTEKHMKVHHGWSQCRLFPSSAAKNFLDKFVPHDSPHRDRLLRLTSKHLENAKTALWPPKAPRRATTNQKPTALGSPEGPRRATVKTGQDRSTILWNMVVPFDSTTCVKKKKNWKSTLHFVMCEKKCRGLCWLLCQ